MLPAREVILAHATAGAFGLVVGLSLVAGASELTAAFRGLVAAIAAALVAPFLHRTLEQALTPGERKP
jgi:multisubunit Na+/H+ antiporter MnhG subunit